VATDQKTERKYIEDLGFLYITFLDNIQHFFWLCASDWHSCQEKGPSFLTRNTVCFSLGGKIRTVAVDCWRSLSKINYIQN